MPDEPSARMPLIYIASIGRSGSTLLESMLGAHTRIATMGEMHIWPHEARRNQRDCACGLPVDDCPVWSKVRAGVDPLTQRPPRMDHFREHHNGGRTLRPRLARALWTNTPADAATAEQIGVYAENNRRTFEAYHDAFRDVTGREVDWLVDASKDPYRLDWFARSELFDLRVIHMIRDPRAYAYSSTRAELDGGVSRSGRLRKTARQSGAWVTQNLLFDRLGRTRLADGYLRVSYEDFATDPHTVFARICSFIGVGHEPAAVANFRSGSVHTMAGNPMRYESRPITPDERWRDGLPRDSRWVVDAVTRASRRRLGY